VAEALQAIIAALTLPGLPGWTGLILALLLGLLVLSVAIGLAWNLLQTPSRAFTISPIS
jgi:hypothetical protein